MKKSAKSGRRTGESTTKADILAAARRRFRDQGYAATTIRAIAADAGVDAALVHYFFGSKDELFGASMELPYSPADIVRPAIEEGLEGAGERLARRFLAIWEDPEARVPLLAMVRSATSQPERAQTLREFVAREVQSHVAALIGTPDGELRGALLGAALVGLAFERYIIELEPLASADPETIVEWVGPSIQRYLTGAPGQP
jgi:AcrR family transcriptional regulator